MTQNVGSSIAPLAVNLRTVVGWPKPRSSSLTATNRVRVTDWMEGWAELTSGLRCEEGDIRRYEDSNSDFQVVRFFA